MCSASRIPSNADIAAVQHIIRKVCFGAICCVQKQIHGMGFHIFQHNTAGLGHKPVIGIRKSISGIMITYHIRVSDDRQRSTPGAVARSGAQLQNLTFGDIKDLNRHTGYSAAVCVNNFTGNSRILYSQQGDIRLQLFLIENRFFLRFLCFLILLLFLFFRLSKRQIAFICDLCHFERIQSCLCVLRKDVDRYAAQHHGKYQGHGHQSVHKPAFHWCTSIIPKSLFAYAVLPRYSHCAFSIYFPL